VLGAERVSGGGAEKAVDLAPGEEHDAREHDEGIRIGPVPAEGQNAHGLERKRNEHHQLSADVVREPPEHRPGEAVDHGVHHQGERQRGHGEEVEVDLDVSDTEVLSDHAQLGHGHQTASDRAGKHRQHHPEHGCAKRLAEGVVAARLRDVHRIRDHGQLRRAEEPGEEEDHAALNQAKREERGLVSGGRDHVGDRNNREDGAGTITGRGQTDRQATLVREPFQRVVDAGRVDRANAEATDHRPEVEAGQGCRVRVDDPGQSRQHTAQEDQESRSVAVDEVADKRRAPRLHHDEDAEGRLNRGALPAVRLLDFGNELRPGVLDVRGGHHAGDAEEQLAPAGCLDLADAARRVRV
jgi:hypothetical protein